jgi:hypothetical protein
MLKGLLLSFLTNDPTLGHTWMLFERVAIDILVVASQVYLALCQVNGHLIDRWGRLNGLKSAFGCDIVNSEGLVEGSTKSTDPRPSFAKGHLSDFLGVVSELCEWLIWLPEHETTNIKEV